MAISDEKLKIVINNYFKSECDVNTSIREAFEKGFRIGVKKGLMQIGADRKTSNSSEIPNNSTCSKMEQVEQRSCDTCKNKDIEGWKNPCLGCTGFVFYEPKDEPQTYVINPQEPTNDDKCFECDDFFTCDGQCEIECEKCKHFREDMPCRPYIVGLECKYEPKTEPQTLHIDKPRGYTLKADTNNARKPKIKPQTERNK